MKSKPPRWAVGMAALLASDCAYQGPNPSAGTASNEGQSTDSRYSAKTPRYLDQGWDHKTRMEWWYTSQGSWVIPYAWFLALERADSEELVRSNANMERLRFITWPADSTWNPDGLPIGFVRDKDTGSGKSYFGFTCAACHTGQIEYKGQTIIVDGGPAHSDFNLLITEIGASLQITLGDNDKFSRFAGRVLGTNAEPSSVKELKNQFAQTTALLAERIKVNHPPYPNGYARLDAFGNIFNEGSVFAIIEPTNAKPANAPVSYPVLWDTPQHDVVQWNGSAVNAGIGPYTRNTGEVVGVFGDLRIERVKVVGSTKLRYKHHIDIKALERVETILTSLWSPVWPENILPTLDREKARRGKQHYDKSCLGCHASLDRTDPNRRIEAKMIPVNKLGTDPTMATNVATSMAKTGIMEGQPMIPITSYIPSLGIIDKFGKQAPTGKVVGNGVLGVLREELGITRMLLGLRDYIKAAKKNALYENCDPKKQGQKCYRPPRYKARPLNGIWASAPFLHNGSVPNLWELLKKPDQRATTFHVGSWEMDPINVGFSTDERPATSKFDTSLPGNSNLGHDYRTDLSDDEKWELIEYIKTL